MISFLTLARAAVGPDLSARIRGRADVECLRRLVGGVGTLEDVEEGRAFVASETAAVCAETWGDPPWTFARVPQVRIANDLIKLRIALFDLVRPDPSAALSSDYPVPVPAGLEMMPFQRAGVEFAAGKSFVIFGDEMGLGKTIQAIGLLNMQPTVGKVLIVCTATLKGNWKSELEKWSTRPFSIVVVEPKHETIPAGDVVIVNYDLLWRREFPTGFDVVIVDEGHNIRGAESKRSVAACAQLSAARLKVVITGTPVVKSAADLVPAIKVSGLPLADEIEGYVTSHVERRPNGRGGWFTIKKDRGHDLEELQTKLRATCLVRRLKKDVLPQLPEKTRQLIEIPELIARYDPATAERIVLRVGQRLGDAEAFRRAVFSRREEVELDGCIATIRREQAIAKAPYVADHIRDILDGDDALKLVVFGYHVDVIKTLEQELVKYKSVTITGKTPPAIRPALVKAFQEGDTRLFIGNIEAAGEGITLHAAATAIFAEIDWDVAQVAQAEDRLHRIGQRSPVTIQHMILRGSIDEMILKSMVAKELESRRTVG